VNSFKEPACILLDRTASGGAILLSLTKSGKAHLDFLLALGAMRPLASPVTTAPVGLVICADWLFE
jgi:hypothetical protein